MKPSPRFFIVAILALLTATASAQNTWYLNAPTPFGIDWNTFSYWSANPTAPLGASPISISNLDTFDTNGFSLRTVDTNGSTTFGGAALRLNNSTLQLKAVTTTIGNLTTLATGGAISNSSAGPTSILNLTLNVTQLTLDGETRIASTLANSRTLAFNVTTLLGSNDLVFGQSLSGTAPSTITFSATNAATFTGDLVLSGTNSSLTFGNNLVTSGGLILNTGSIVTLNKDLTFTALTIGGINLAPGTYSFATLNSTYDAYFANIGSGSITVLAAAPEPATAALFIFAGLTLIFRRRLRA